MDSEVRSDAKEVLLILVCLIAWVFAAIAVMVCVIAGMAKRFDVLGISLVLGTIFGLAGYLILRRLE